MGLYSLDDERRQLNTGAMDSQEEIQEVFGLRLRLVRERRGLSQEKLALACGLDRTYVSSIDRGKSNPTLVNIYRLAEALAVNPSIFLLNDDAFQAALDEMPMQGIRVGRPKSA